MQFRLPMRTSEAQMSFPVVGREGVEFIGSHLSRLINLNELGMLVHSSYMMNNRCEYIDVLFGDVIVSISPNGMEPWSEV